MVHVLHEIAQPVLGIARIGRGARRWDETREAFRRREARIEQGDDETRLRRADPDFQGFDRECGARLAGGDAQDGRTEPLPPVPGHATGDDPLSDEDQLVVEGGAQQHVGGLEGVRAFTTGRDGDDGAEDPGGMLDVVVQDPVEHVGRRLRRRARARRGGP